MNDLFLENKYEESPNVQIKTSRTPKNGSEKILKENLKNCMLKEKFRKHMVELLDVGVLIV
jgi:hypothetical protein